jgi:hypothetical protein
MKKLIAISVMCALVVGAAFAETSLGGQVFVGGALLRGDNIKDSQPTTVGLGNDQYNTALKVSFSEGSAGGRIRILGTNAGASDIFDEWFGWWRPIPQLRIQVGVNKDGDWGTAQISGWGFTGENKNNGDGSPGNQGAMAEYNGYQEGRNHSRTAGWYGGISSPSLNISLYPIDGLTVNIAFPWTSGNAGFTLSKFEAQVQYRLTDIGTVSLSFQSNTGYLEADPDSWHPDGVTDPTQSPKIFASFYLTAIDGMGLDLGVAYKFPFENTSEYSRKNTGGETVTNHPVEIGLGFRYGQGDFSFKLRGSVSLGESTVTQGVEKKQTPQISASILPSYKVGTVTVFFYTGMGIPSVADGEEADFNWFVNPYVFIPAGGLRFKVGFQLWSNGYQRSYWQDEKELKDPAVINWSIPFGFYAYF